jgi:hypothetical protein
VIEYLFFKMVRNSPQIKDLFFVHTPLIGASKKLVFTRFRDNVGWFLDFLGVRGGGLVSSFTGYGQPCGHDLPHFGRLRVVAICGVMD